jgi:hypothetical protein
MKTIWLHQLQIEVLTHASKQAKQIDVQAPTALRATDTTLSRMYSKIRTEVFRCRQPAKMFYCRAILSSWCIPVSLLAMRRERVRHAP